MHGGYGGTLADLVSDVDEVLGFLGGMTAAPALVVPRAAPPPPLQPPPRYQRPPVVPPPPPAPSPPVAAPRLPLQTTPRPEALPPVPQSLIDADDVAAAAVPPPATAPPPLPIPTSIRLLGLPPDTVELVSAAVEVAEVGDGPGRVVIENKHSTDVASPPPPPLVCERIHRADQFVSHADASSDVGLSACCQ
jgi:hypothetical protein